MNLIYKPENNGKNIEEYDCYYLTGYTEQELISFTGAGIGKGNDRIVKITGIYPTVTVTISCVEFLMIRMMNFEDKVINNQLLKVRKKREGIGLEIIERQVAATSKAGFTRLDVFAMGNSKTSGIWSGYIALAKLGFTMIDEEQELFQEFMRKHQRKDATLNALVQTIEGSKFWEENGYPWAGTFDLADSSINKKILTDYMNR